MHVCVCFRTTVCACFYLRFVRLRFVTFCVCACVRACVRVARALSTLVGESHLPLSPFSSSLLELRSRPSIEHLEGTEFEVSTGKQYEAEQA